MKPLHAQNGVSSCIMKLRVFQGEFLEIDGIVIPTNDFNSTTQFPEKEHPYGNTRDNEDDSESEY